MKKNENKKFPLSRDLVEEAERMGRIVEFLYSCHKKKGKIETPKDLVEIKKLADKLGAFTLLNELISYGLCRLGSEIITYKVIIKAMRNLIENEYGDERVADLVGKIKNGFE